MQINLFVAGNQFRKQEHGERKKKEKKKCIFYEESEAQKKARKRFLKLLII